MNKLSRIHLFLVICVFFFLLSACGRAESQSSDELQGTITISGAWALYPMMNRWAEEFQKVNPGVQFDISAGGAGKGMADALAGAVDIGMVSRDVTPEEEAKGAYWFPVTKDAVFPTVNAQNPVLESLLSRGVTREQFIGIFITGEITTWGQVVDQPVENSEIHVYTRSDAAGAPETWAKYLGKAQEDLLGVAIFGDPGVLEAVVKDPLGIGFNNLNYVYDMTTGEPVKGVVVLPIDNNENGMTDPEELIETKDEAVQVVANGLYPSPPARLLNLVTRGKPTGIVALFIEWILTDGQSFVNEAGYVQLTQEQLTIALEKLK